MKLNELLSNPGSSKPRKRVGRGIGSGTGKTSGRGQKGQKSRTGVAIKGFEGGQMPLYRRLPKRGFNKPNRLAFAEVNLDRLQKAFDAKKLDAKKDIDTLALKEAGVISKTLNGVRILGRGEITTKANFVVAGITETAQKAIEKAGGKVTVEAFKASQKEVKKDAPVKGVAKRAKAAKAAKDKKKVAK